MYPNTGYYGQPYGQPYPSGNPYTMGTTQYSSPQSQMQYPPFNPTNAQQRPYQPQQASQISGRVVQNENEITIGLLLLILALQILILERIRL